MWFRLALSTYSPTLGCLIGQDGRLYWRLVDLGSLLGRANPHSFASHRPHQRGTDVLPVGFSYPLFTAKAQIVDTQMAHQCLLQHNLELANQFETLLNDGYCHVTRWENNSMGNDWFSVKTSPVLMANDEGNFHIPTWINVYKNQIQNWRQLHLGISCQSIHVPEEIEETDVQESPSRPPPQESPSRPPPQESPSRPPPQDSPSHPPPQDSPSHPETENSLSHPPPPESPSHPPLQNSPISLELEMESGLVVRVAVGPHLIGQTFPLPAMKVICARITTTPE